MPFVIKIADEIVERREIRGRNGSFTAEHQNGVADMPNGERRLVRVRLPRGQASYKPGFYRVGDDSFGVNQWGDLEISQLHLVPVESRPANGAGAAVSQSAASARV